MNEEFKNVIILSGTEKKVISTQGKGFNNADSEKSIVLFQMSLLTTDNLIENAIVNKIVLTLQCTAKKNFLCIWTVFRPETNPTFYN